MNTLDNLNPSSDQRLSSPAAQRNRGPILDVLRQVLPAHAHVLEIASGSGEHAIHFARALPGISWQPSDPSETACRSIAAWVAHERNAHEALTNVQPPLTLDVTHRPWPDAIGRPDAIVCINMIHIAPWAAAQALFEEAAQRLAAHGMLVLYGPFKRNGRHTADSNHDFDLSLRGRDPAWGIRDLDGEVIPLVTRAGFALDRVVEMPANNLSVVWRKAQ